MVTDGIGFADGPCSDDQGNFYFSDLKANAIYRIGLDGTKTKVVDEPGSGLKVTPGRIYACQGSKKRLVQIDWTAPGGNSAPAQPTVTALAENVDPNDLAISKDGIIYFTETGKHQVTMVDPKTKTVKAADTGIAGPNGIAFSPDGGTLAVSDYNGEFVWAFAVQADGSLTAKAPYMTMRRPIDPKGDFQFNNPPPYKSAAGGDGMCTDTDGRYYVATALGVQIFDPIGRLCGVLPKPQSDRPLTNCVLAGPNHEYLYVTNGDKVFRRRVKASGTVLHLAQAGG
jgi:enterochelin esterase family protein